MNPLPMRNICTGIVTIAAAVLMPGLVFGQFAIHEDGVGEPSSDGQETNRPQGRDNSAPGPVLRQISVGFNWQSIGVGFEGVFTIASYQTPCHTSDRSTA